MDFMISNNNNRPLLLLTSKGLNDPLGRQLFKANIHPGEDDRALLISIDEYGVGALLKKSCVEMGFKEENIFLCETRDSVEELMSQKFIAHPSGSAPHFAMIYIGEGNTYQMLDLITKDITGEYTSDFLHFLKSEVDKGSKYCGASAGAAIAGVDIKLLKEYAERELNFSGLSVFDGIGAFPGSIIPHYTRDDFIRFFYSKSIHEIEMDKSRYSQLGWVDNESILIWDPEETIHLLTAYYSDTNTINDLEFFLETASNIRADIFLYDRKDYDVKKVSLLQKKSECVSDTLCLNGCPAYLIPKRDTTVHRIYTLTNRIYGFRIMYQDQKLDIIVCTE